MEKRLLTLALLLIWIYTGPVILFQVADAVGICPYGFYGANCEQNATVCATTRCYGQGACTGVEEGCSCDPGYFLDACAYNQSTCGTVYCAGNGTCIPNGNALTPSCLCRTIGWNSSTQCTECMEGFDLATNCTQCVPYAYGLSCTLNTTQCREELCASHGDCYANGTGCTCDPAWTSPDSSLAGSANCTVSACAEGIEPTDDGQGCDCVWPYQQMPLNPLVCALLCNYPHGSYSTTQEMCICRNGYTGSECTLAPSRGLFDTDEGAVLITAIAVLGFIPIVLLFRHRWIRARERERYRYHHLIDPIHES